MNESMTLDEQAHRLALGTEEILPPGELEARLRACAEARRPLRVKQGFDPTAPDIHLGHTVGLRKLRQFQDLGHQVVLIVGDYTGMVGDPSGLSKTRPQLTRDEVDRNAATYLEQFYRVLERAPRPPRLPVEVHRNGEWFGAMSFMDIMKLASTFTVSQILEREDFSKRFHSEQPIAVHELFYPLMQGYDSVAIHSDLEIGGTEQKFNLLVGRELQRLHGQPPQVVMTLPLLPGLDGVQRMSKSLGNYVGVTDPPGDMFGKVMSLPDPVMSLFWRLVTDAEPGELEAIGRDLADPRVNPMSVKTRLAGRIVTMYHGAEAARRAQDNFEAQFGRREIPADLPVWTANSADEMGIKDLLVRSGLAKSGSEAWRAVDQGAVSIDQTRVNDRNHRQSLSTPFVLRLGRRMIRVEPPRANTK
jgi:tyrosyl-tRNA synthetase